MKKKMTEFISFRVSPEVLRKLEFICERNSESRSQVLIGLIISEYAWQNARSYAFNPNDPSQKDLLYKKEENQK